jgi:hypothetical protein
MFSSTNQVDKKPATRATEKRGKYFRFFLTLFLRDAAGLAQRAHSVVF